jgi:hypothetical protein
MTCTDLIIELSKLPPDMEVMYQLKEDENGFVMVVVRDLGEIITDNEEHFVMINPRFNEEEENDNK